MSHLNQSSSNESSFTAISKASGIFWCTSFGLVGLLIFGSNLATIVTFAINKDLRRQGIYCLLNLAMADMLLGGVIIPYYITDIVELFLQWRPIGSQIYIIVRGFYITVLIASLFGLVVVSLNRIYATYLPYKHRAMKTKSHVITFVATWLLATAASATFFLLKQLQDHIVLVFQGLFVLALVIIITSYVAILVKIKSPNNVQSQHQRSTPLSQRRERQLASTVFLVTVLSLATWVPSIVFHGIYKTQTSGFNINLQLAIYLIQSTNSLINPVIYAFRMKDFRKALFRLLTTCLPIDSSATVHPASLRCEEINEKDRSGDTNSGFVSNDDIILDTKF